MAAKTLPSATPPAGLGFVAQMRPALVKYFKRKTGNITDAEDLAQDVLVSALAKQKWSTQEEAKGYVFRTAINRLHDRRRREDVHGVAVPYDEEKSKSGSENPLECVLIAQEELAVVARALDDLNIRTRTVLILIRLENMKAATVADMLGISVRAVNKHLQKGVDYLAKALAGKDLHL